MTQGFKYKVGETYPIVCSWTQCSKHFTWEVKQNTNDKRVCCSPKCGLRGKMHHTLKALVNRDKDKWGQDGYIMSIEDACNCIVLRASYLGLKEIASQLDLSLELVTYLLTDELTLERHHSDINGSTHRIEGASLRSLLSKRYKPITIELKQEIEAKLKQGTSPFRLSKYYDIPRNRIYKIKEGMALTKEDLMSIPGAKDMTDEINALRIELKAEAACNSRIPEEITLNGKKYREVLD